VIEEIRMPKRFTKVKMNLASYGVREISRVLPFAVFVAVIGASFIFGCASTPNDELRPQKEYRTGSNLPVRDRDGNPAVKTVNPDDYERMRPPVSMPPPGAMR
jgi:hypothetical protein